MGWGGWGRSWAEPSFSQSRIRNAVWTSACGPTRIRLSTLRLSPKATAFGSRRRAATCSGSSR
eukprot:4730578-Alexandrium_andersonii.AAC.1